MQRIAWPALLMISSVGCELGRKGILEPDAREVHWAHDCAEGPGSVVRLDGELFMGCSLSPGLIRLEGTEVGVAEGEVFIQDVHLGPDGAIYMTGYELEGDPDGTALGGIAQVVRYDGREGTVVLDGADVPEFTQLSSFARHPSGLDLAVADDRRFAYRFPGEEWDTASLDGGLSFARQGGGLVAHGDHLVSLAGSDGPATLLVQEGESAVFEAVTIHEDLWVSMVGLDSDGETLAVAANDNSYRTGVIFIAGTEVRSPERWSTFSLPDYADGIRLHDVCTFEGRIVAVGQSGEVGVLFELFDGEFVEYYPGNEPPPVLTACDIDADGLVLVGQSGYIFAESGL